MDLLLYHDLVEVEAGDTYAHDKEAVKTKAQREEKGFKKLLNNIPKELADKYARLYREYEEKKTPEAKFANAVDKLDPIIHSLEDRHFWKKCDLCEKDIRQVKERHLSHSQEFMEVLDKLIDHLKKNKFIK